MFKLNPQFLRFFLPAPLAFFEVQIKHVFREAVEFAQSTFREGPERFDPVDVNATSFRKFVLAMIHSVMTIEAHIHEPIIAAPAIGIDDRISRNTPANQGLERLFLRIRHYLGEHATVALKDAEDRLLHRPAAALQFAVESTLPFRAMIRFVHFDFAAHELMPEFGAPPEDREAEIAEKSIHRLAVHARKRSRSRRVDVETETGHQFGNFAMAEFRPFYNAHVTILPCG